MDRRGFITGLISFAATAPAIVRAASLMPVKPERLIDPTEEVIALLKRRIADAENVMMENIKTCIFGDTAIGISGQSNNFYYEPLYQLKMNGVEIVFDEMCPKDTIYLLPERK